MPARLATTLVVIVAFLLSLAAGFAYASQAVSVRTVVWLLSVLLAAYATWRAGASQSNQRG